MDVGTLRLHKIDKWTVVLKELTKWRLRHSIRLERILWIV